MSENVQLVREHWEALSSARMKGLVLNAAFLHLMSQQPHVRVIWPFGRGK